MTSVSAFLREANSALDGTPYSIDDTDGGLHRVTQIMEKVNRVQQVLVRLPENNELSGEVRNILRTREVFESNAIESVGLPLPETNRLLEQYPVGRQPTQEFVQWVVQRAIQQDRRVYEVLGMEAARRLAQEVSLDFSRPLSEADLRSLHGIILGRDEGSGIYKRYVNSIAGSDHSPSLPVDTPADMRALANWLTALPSRSYRTMGSVIRAAAAHAWLAHIHPFEDGNGRLARLLANIMLSREGMPPLILRNKGDRAKYIDALARSDSAGDLSRLILVFASAIERIALQMGDPRTAQHLFEEDLDLRRQGTFKYWERSVGEWTRSLVAELLLWNLHGELVGSLVPSDFSSLRNGKAVSKAWFLETRDVRGTRGMWFFGYPSSSLYRRLEKDQVFPVLKYSVSNPDVRGAKPFVLPQVASDWPIEFMLEPYEQRVYVTYGNGRFSVLDPDFAAKVMASMCADLEA